VALAAVAAVAVVASAAVAVAPVVVGPPAAGEADVTGAQSSPWPVAAGADPAPGLGPTRATMRA